MTLVKPPVCIPRAFVNSQIFANLGVTNVFRFGPVFLAMMPKGPST